MNKKIKYRIKFAKLEDVESTSNNAINLKAGKTLSTVSIYNSSLRQTLKPDPNGDFFEQTLGLKDVLESTLVNTFRNPHIFELTLFDGTVFIWGSVDNPVILLSAIDVDGATELTLSRKATDIE